MLKLGQLITSQGLISVQVKELHVSTFKSKVEMIKVREGSMLKARLGQNIGLLHQRVRQVLNIKKKVLGRN